MRPSGLSPARRSASVLAGLFALAAACKPEPSPAPATAGDGALPSPERPQAGPDAEPAPEAGAAPGAASGTVEPAPGAPKAAAISPAPEGSPSAAAPPEGPPPAAALPEKSEYKVLILGDSLAATGFGALLEKRLDAHERIVCYRKAKSSTGLARPDFFDWIDQAKRQIEFRTPDLVVVIMGGNDGQDLTSVHANRRSVRWNTPEWKSAYATRVNDLLAQLVSAERRVLWLGMPPMGLKSLEQKLELIRSVHADAAKSAGARVRYLDTASFLATPEGEVLREAKIKGRTHALRTEDKIHFTMPGSEYFADKVYPAVLEELGLTAP